MNIPAIEANAADLEQEFAWFLRILQQRIGIHFENKYSEPEFDRTVADAPALNPESSLYAEFITSLGLKPLERVIFLLALAPHFKPELLDVLIINNPERNQIYTEIGGKKLRFYRGFIPTAETAQFILAGNNSARRLLVGTLFSADHKFALRGILKLTNENSDEAPELSGILSISRDILDLLLAGQIRKPDYTPDFPAKRIASDLDWEDLILAPVTLRQIEEVKMWLRHENRLMNELGMNKRIRPGSKILFYGPPGTGKTLTASLLGKFIQKEVFRIDLSIIVSKYIGETEKNLAKIFDRAQDANWILFFDEADALFGSRTKVTSAHDRYANQEVSYLLQRIEDYTGIIILATNMKGNIDDAFMRRFNVVVNFPFPKMEERQLIWKKAFSDKIILAEDIDLRKVAEKYELAGGSIVNIATWCQLMALENNNYEVTNAILREGIAREIAKDGKTL